MVMKQEVPKLHVNIKQSITADKPLMPALFSLIPESRPHCTGRHNFIAVERHAGALDMKKTCVARGFSPCLTAGSNEQMCLKAKFRPTQKTCGLFSRYSFIPKSRPKCPGRHDFIAIERHGFQVGNGLLDWHIIDFVSSQ